MLVLSTSISNLKAMITNGMLKKDFLNLIPFLNHLETSIIICQYFLAKVICLSWPSQNSTKEEKDYKSF